MSPRNTRIIIVVVFIAAALIAVLTYPLWRPLFGAETATTVDGTLAPSSEDVVISDTLPDLDAEPLLIAFGTFNAFDENNRRGEGTTLVYDVPETGWILRLEDFRVPNLPGLRIALSVNMPVAANTPLEFGYVDLGALKGNAGDQNYPIPQDVDLSRFSAVVITNASFNDHITAAELTAG